MRFSSVALAATVSAAAVTAPAANVEATGSPASTNNLWDLSTAATQMAADPQTFNWAKGWGAGDGKASSYVEVDSTAAADVTFSIVWTGDLTNAGATTKEDSCTTIPTAVAAAPTTTGDTAAMTAAQATNKIYVLATWTAAQWKGDEAVTVIEGAGTALTVKTAAANAAVVATTAAESTCTSSITYTVPKDAANIAVTAHKDAASSLKMGDAKSYATVKAVQQAAGGCNNAVGKLCPVGDAAAVDDGAAVAGGLGIYQGVKAPGKGFLWAINIKAAAAADGAAADTKKSATTLAIGAAAGLVAAAIA